MIKRYIANFNPENELFVLNDTIEEILIVIEKDQLKELIKLYKQCYEDYNEL